MFYLVSVMVISRLTVIRFSFKVQYYFHDHEMRHSYKINGNENRYILSHLYVVLMPNILLVIT